MVYCCAFGCSHRSSAALRMENGVTFHKFPFNQPKILHRWITNTKRVGPDGKAWQPSQSTRICSVHFTAKCFDRTGQTTRLRDGAVPTVFDFAELLQNCRKPHLKKPCATEKIRGRRSRKILASCDVPAASTEKETGKLEADESETDEEQAADSQAETDEERTVEELPKSAGKLTEERNLTERARRNSAAKHSTTAGKGRKIIHRKSSGRNSESVHGKSGRKSQETYHRPQTTRKRNRTDGTETDGKRRKNTDHGETDQKWRRTDCSKMAQSDIPLDQTQAGRNRQQVNSAKTGHDVLDPRLLTCAGSGQRGQGLRVQELRSLSVHTPAYLHWKRLGAQQGLHEDTDIACFLLKYHDDMSRVLPAGLTGVCKTCNTPLSVSCTRCDWTIFTNAACGSRHLDTPTDQDLMEGPGGDEISVEAREASSLVVADPCHHSDKEPRGDDRIADLQTALPHQVRKSTTPPRVWIPGRMETFHKRSRVLAQNTPGAASSPEGDTAEEPSSPVGNSTEEPSSPVVNSTEEPSSPVVNFTEEPSSPVVNSTEEPSSPVGSIAEEPFTPMGNSTEEPFTPVDNADLSQPCRPDQEENEGGGGDRRDVGELAQSCFLDHSYNLPSSMIQEVFCHPQPSTKTATDGSRGPNQCDVCGKIYSSHKSLREHKIIHTGERTFSCERCGKAFFRRSTLKRHTLTHTDKQFACSSCSAKFRAMPSLISHQEIHQEQRSFECETCGKMFKRRRNLQHHQLIHSEENIIFKCDVCGKTFRTERRLGNHKCGLGAENPLACKECGEGFSQPWDLLNHMSDHSKSYICDKCGQTFAVRRSLQRHQRKHSSLKPYICETCAAAFKARFSLKRHQLIVHAGLRPFSCDICNKKFSQSSSLKNHMKTHFGPGRHMCASCPRTFPSPYTLKVHQLVHSGQAPKRQRPKWETRKCYICDQTFQHTYSYKIHMIAHMADHSVSGVKTYPCEVCSKHLAFPSLLRSHMACAHPDHPALIAPTSHTKPQGPLSCKECGKTFSVPWNFRRHQLTHTGVKPFQCDVCLKRFTQAVSVEKHKLVHTGVKAFECDICKKAFTEKGTLTKHKMIHLREMSVRDL